MEAIAMPDIEESQPQPGPPVKLPAAIRFTMEGDLRHLSNHDELRMLTRAIIRAGWPLAYSQGFNPKPRVRLPLPRSVGTASRCELGLADLNAAMAVEELATRLRGSLPEQVRLLGVLAPAPAGTPHPLRAEYRLELTVEEAATAAGRLDALLALESIEVVREGAPGRGARTVEIRPFIERVTLDERRLVMVLKFEQQRTARCAEVLSELGLPGTALQQRTVLAQIDWDMEFAAWHAPAAAM